MALSGSVSIEATRSGRDMLVFSWEAVQDQRTMTSTVSWKMELVADSYGRIDQSTPQPWVVTIDGQEFSGTASVNIANNETKQLATGDVVLTHNEDGTRSFAFTFSQELNITWGASSGDPIYIGVVSGEGSGELDALSKKFPIKEWLKGYLLSLCSPRRAFPQREPIGYLYGREAKEGEEYTHEINGTKYVGVVAPDIYSVYTPELQEEYPYAYITQAGDDAEDVDLPPEYNYACYLQLLHKSAHYFYHSYDGDHCFGGDPYIKKCPSIVFTKLLADNEWGEGEERHNDFIAGWYRDLVKWTNFDLSLDDLKVDAIKPIPIYE